MTKFSDTETCKHRAIVLFPDFASSGMWCADCGIGFGDPKSRFKNIPAELIDLVDGWNALWELACDNKDISVSYFQEIINKSGEILAKMVNQYFPCEFDADASKIFMLHEKG